MSGMMGMEGMGDRRLLIRVSRAMFVWDGD
jgi:hypothetical protein